MALAVRSMLVLGIIFAMAFALAAAALYYAHAPTWLAVIVALVISGLQYLLAPYIIQFIFKIRWVPTHELPDALRRTVQRLSAEHGIPLPRVGIIDDGNPNAFTFGHHPRNARIVVTRGLLEICDEREVEAVVAHEFGHIVHWDFVVMTIAVALVMTLYYIYVFGRYARARRGRNGGAVVLIALGAFVAYIIAEYLVLFLSRTREYYADEFSARATRDPNALSTALVKIAWGLAAQAERPAGEEQEEAAEEKPAPLPLRGVRTLGIFDPSAARAFVQTITAGYAVSERTYDPEVVSKAMLWDLFNPWAALAELHSSHPLPAKRIRALGKLAEKVGQRPVYDLPDRPPESYWDEFFVDLAMNYLPVIGFLAGGLAGLPIAMASPLEPASIVATLGAALFGAGVGSILRLRFAYPPGPFKPSTVAGLVANVRVSFIRCVPATLRGRIIGRGIPGLLWSEDLVVRNHTGFMVLDYRQPIRLFQWLFGLLRAERFIGQDVEVTGWYRRYPRPFLEVWQIRTPDGAVNTCWVWPVKRVSAWLVAVIGLLMLLTGLLLLA